jgi:hypothetical protein
LSSALETVSALAGEEVKAYRQLASPPSRWKRALICCFVRQFLDGMKFPDEMKQF